MERAESEGFAIRIPNTDPPLYVAFGRVEAIFALVGPHPIDQEGDEPAANDAESRSDVTGQPWHLEPAR